jgi:hypothetical protein
VVDDRLHVGDGRLKERILLGGREARVPLSEEVVAPDAQVNQIAVGVGGQAVADVLQAGGRAQVRGRLATDRRTRHGVGQPVGDEDRLESRRRRHAPAVSEHDDSCGDGGRGVKHR